MTARCIYCYADLIHDAPGYGPVYDRWIDEGVLDYDNDGAWCEINEEHQPAAEYDPNVPCIGCGNEGAIEGRLCGCPAGDMLYDDYLEMVSR